MIYKVMRNATELYALPSDLRIALQGGFRERFEHSSYAESGRPLTLATFSLNSDRHFTLGPPNR